MRPTAQVVEGYASRPLVRGPDGAVEPLPFYVAFEPGERVLDVGCGEGVHLRELRQRGCDAVGVEVQPELVERLNAEGLCVVEARAERLPFPDADFDAVISSVVVPYTDERQAIAEWARVLRPGGEVRASFHGLGYGLHYLLCQSPWRMRLYGSRMLVNTGYYRLTGRRLPGRWGDTLCQSPRRLDRYYREAGLGLMAEYVHPGPAGMPRLIYHRLRKASA